MRSTIRKIELYIASLCLLFLLIIVITIDPGVYDGDSRVFIGWGAVLRKNIAPLVSAAFLMCGFLCCALFNYRIKGSMSIPLPVSSVRSIEYEHLTFLTTYIVPLACLDLAQPRYAAVLTVLLLTIGAIYVKTDKFYANPTLALLGFKLYSADIVKRTGETTRAVIITKDCLNDDACIRAIALDNSVYFAKEVK